MSLLLPGFYVSSETAIHRLDPRIKMGATMVLMVLPFAAPNLLSSLLLVVFVLAVLFVSAVPARALLRTLRTVLWAGLFISLFRFFTTPGKALLTLGRLEVTWQGLAAGGAQIYRLCLLVVVSSLLTFTTSPSQLGQGLEAALGPLARLGLPVREATLVLTIALRFVPTLVEEVDKIIKAQEARGACVRTGPVWKRAQGWVAVFVPIFISAFRRATDLAMAMEARGFRGAGQRTYLHQLCLGRRDLVACLVVMVLTVLVLLIEWRLY